MPASIAKQPVTFVSLDDARAFCAHQGLRLPHAWEWQWIEAGQLVMEGRIRGAPAARTCPPARR
jgi:formylglycine-generating enzyme required for sulfatase activity